MDEVPFRMPFEHDKFSIELMHLCVRYFESKSLEIPFSNVRPSFEAIVGFAPLLDLILKHLRIELDRIYDLGDAASREKLK